MAIGFQQRPCKSREELYDRKEEVDQVIRLIRQNTWVALMGLRMAGKTSVAQTVQSELQREFSSAYVDLRGARGVRTAAERIINALPKDVLQRIGKFIANHVEQIQAESFGIKLRKGEDATSVLETLFGLLSKNKKLLLVLDEVQDVGGGTNHFLNMLSRIRNTSKRVNFIFTGSEINLMKVILNPEKTALAGRTPVKIDIVHWGKKIANSFLREGLNHCGVIFSEKEIDEVVDTLGTLPGWLNFYGLRRCSGQSHDKSLAEARIESVAVASTEFQHLLAGRGAWVPQVIRTIASYSARWKDLGADAPPKGLNDLLKRLKDSFIMTEENGRYSITDPVYNEAAKRLK